MPTYVIGDIQGCLDGLLALLKKINFRSDRDRLWLTGDLVNRGGQSLEMLRWSVANKDNLVAVLGNHDLHLLAMAHGVRRSRNRSRELATVMSAKDAKRLFKWLRRRPLFHWDRELGYALVHAGLAPNWDLNLAEKCSRKVSKVLRGKKRIAFFNHMYGDKPDRWTPELKKWDELRTITNIMTRMRFCDASGRMDLARKGAPGGKRSKYLPWYAIPNRQVPQDPIVFGHWSTLGLMKNPPYYCIDTGYVWRRELTAMRLRKKRKPIFVQLRHRKKVSRR